MKHLILLLALVAVTKAFFLKQLINAYTGPVVKPTIEVKPNNIPLPNYVVSEYSSLNPVTPLLTSTNIVYQPLFQNVIKQAISQGASIDLTELSSSDYQKLIQLMKVSPAVESPIYIPPVNVLPLEQVPSVSISGSSIVPSEKTSAELESDLVENIKHYNSSPAPATEIDDSPITDEVSVDKEETNEIETNEIETNEIETNEIETKEIEQNNQLPSETHAVDFNGNDNIISEKFNSLPGDEDFSHSYILEDGTKVAEKGYVIKNEDGSEILSKQGNYEWVDANGKLIKVNWIADENGFRVLE